VDVGCGKLRNSLVLVRTFRLWIVDFPEVLVDQTVKKRLAGLVRHHNFMGFLPAKDFTRGKLRVDAAILAFVLHALSEPRLRAQLLKHTVKNTRAPHEVFVAVPNCEKYYRQRMSPHNRLNDGHLFGSGRGPKTFYREYSALELDGFMDSMGFEVDKVFPADRKNQRTYVKK
jgi:uncharacterized C2H2 Zn-finger protein